MSIFKDSLKTIILSVLTLLLVGIAYAWTEPGQSPPGGNLSAPITISSVEQTKSGNLVVNSLATVNGLIVQSGDLNVTNGLIRGNINQNGCYWTGQDTICADGYYAAGSVANNSSPITCIAQTYCCKLK